MNGPSVFDDELRVTTHPDFARVRIRLMLNRSFWKGRRVFLTGHTGFKGSWLSLWLDALGAECHRIRARSADPAESV